MQCPPTFGCELAEQNMRVGANFDSEFKVAVAIESFQGCGSVKVALSRAAGSRVGKSLAFVRFSSWFGTFAEGDLGPSGVGSLNVLSGVKF